MKPYEITLDLRRNLHQVLVMKEGDANSRVIYAKITDNGKPYSVPSAYLTVQWTKPDGNVVQNIIHTMVDDSTVEIVCTDQMLAVSGIARADITIATENEILSPMKFNISIDESAVSKNIIESSHEFGALNDLLAKNNSLGDDLRELESQLEEAESERVIAENERKVNEEIRKTNEDNREDAENLRETNTSTAIQNTNNATILANTATQNAEDATEAAINATAKTNEATQKANTTIDKMESLMKDDNIIHTDKLGVAGGVATLDENGNIPSSMLPSFVNDVLDGNYDAENDQFIDLEGKAYVPESDKIYIDVDDRVTYRWSGTTFVEIGSSLALGETENCAFSGSRGVALEKKVADIEKYHNNIPATDIKFDNTDTHLLSAEVQGAIVELTKPATRTKDGLLSASDKTLIDNYANIQEIEVVLSASKWVGDSAPYTQTITITDLTAYNNCSVELNPIATTEQETAIIEADIDDNILYDESMGLTLVANGTKPIVDIPILLCVGTSMNIVGVPYYLGDLDKAENISYDNSDSSLDGTNVKSAIDELDDKKQNASTAITTSNIGSQSVNKASYDSGGYHIHNTFDQILNGYLPLGGGILNGNIIFPTNYGIQGNIADNDYWRMYGGSAGSNAGFLEIATADDGNEPIYVRQYTGTFASCARTATLLDGSGNTSFPGTVSANGFSTSGGGQLASDGNVYVNSPNNGCVGWLSNLLASKLSTSASCNRNWNWSGQGGQPTWLWGGEDGTNMYVYNPANFSVHHANYASNGANNTFSCGYAKMYHDSEGGNFRVTAPNGTAYGEFDAFSNSCARIYFSADGLNETSGFYARNGSADMCVTGKTCTTFRFNGNAIYATETNTISCGMSDRLFKTVYAKTGTINTSDRTKKHNICDIDEIYEKLFLKLQPKSFIFNDGDRIHIGAISQDVEDVMSELGIKPEEFAGFCKDIKYDYLEYDEHDTPVESSKYAVKDDDGNPIYNYSLRYQEFIFLTIHMVQKTIKRLDSFEERLAKLENSQG